MEYNNNKSILQSKSNITDLEVQILYEYIKDFYKTRENYAESKTKLFTKLSEYNINPRTVINDWDNKI